MVKLNVVQSQSVTLYPNPTHYVIHVTGLENATEVKVYNMHGQLVVSSKVDASTITLDVADLSAGQYFIQILSQHNDIETYHCTVVK